MSRGTLDAGPEALLFAYRAITFCGSSFQKFQLSLTSFLPVLNPSKASFTGLGSSPFARRYLGNLV